MSNSLLSIGNADYVDSLYRQYLADPNAVGAEWQRYFASLEASPSERTDGLAAHTASSAGLPSPQADVRQAAVSRLMVYYANRGHLAAKIEPLGLSPRVRPSVLELENSGLGTADLDTEFFTGSKSHWLPRFASLREILRRYEHVYCGSVGAEFAHVSDTDERIWLHEEFQLGRMGQRFDAETQKTILGS